MASLGIARAIHLSYIDIANCEGDARDARRDCRRSPAKRLNMHHCSSTSLVWETSPSQNTVTRSSGLDGKYLLIQDREGDRVPPIKGGREQGSNFFTKNSYRRNPRLSACKLLKPSSRNGS